MLACFDVPSTIPIGLAACDGFFEPKEKAKYLDEDSLGLEALQPIEIPQNGQSFLWKSLEQNSRDLEKLGEKLGGGGAPPNRVLPRRGAPCRARVLDRADERHRDRHVEAETAVLLPFARGRRNSARARLRRRNWHKLRSYF
jgi:hypothetical protein